MFMFVGTYFYRFGLAPYLLTPILHPHGRAEAAYNYSHIHTRVVIERAFGVLKSRFRCLHKSGGSLTYAPAKCCNIILACTILHNMCIDANVDLAEDGDDDDNEDDGNSDSSDDEDDHANDNAPNRRVVRDGWQVRRDLINHRFV